MTTKQAFRLVDVVPLREEGIGGEVEGEREDNEFKHGSTPDPPTYG